MKRNYTLRKDNDGWVVNSYGRNWGRVYKVYIDGAPFYKAVDYPDRFKTKEAAAEQVIPNAYL